MSLRRYPKTAMSGWESCFGRFYCIFPGQTKADKMSVKVSIYSIIFSLERLFSYKSRGKSWIHWRLSWDSFPLWTSYTIFSGIASLRSFILWSMTWIWKRCVFLSLGQYPCSFFSSIFGIVLNLKTGIIYCYMNEK